jgi:hypothetical protein
MYSIPELSKSTQFGDYSLASYKKHEMYNGLHRSVIYKNGKVVCFSPPKSISYNEFCEKHQIEQCVVDEFIDGTMINIFFDKELEEPKWIISTRSIVGANCTFYTTKTFLEMFQETNIDYEVLNKEYCYSFVLQHPENRIVTPITKPVLWLIAVYHIHMLGISEVHSSNHCITVFPTPASFVFSSYAEAEKFVHEQPYTFKGLMIKTQGERTKIRNPAYEKVKKLRGNSSSLLFTYLTLRSTEDQTEYEKYFPDHCFPLYEGQLNTMISLLHGLYVECFIKKVKPLREYDSHYKKHLYELHMHYLHRLRQEKKYVSKHEVKKYLITLPPAMLVTLISTLQQS